MLPLHFGSLTRIAALDQRPFDVAPCPRADWQDGDYVVGEVLGEANRTYTLEWPDGRMGEVAAGDRVVGALGSRYATLELVGDWREIGADLRFEAVSAAGVFARCTSRAVTCVPPMPLQYEGHVHLEGAPARMRQFARPARGQPFALPVVLLIGTSMECGKTSAARAVIRRLKRQGYRVGGAKLAGVARYRDVLSMRDAGADFILDFVDIGLPSTLVPPHAFTDYVDRMLAILADQLLDVAVVEVGASPMEPYNGEVAIERLRADVRLTILAASDAYAVLGARDHLSIQPDLVVGRVANTSAGAAIVERLTGVPAVNTLDPAATPILDELLAQLF